MFADDKSIESLRQLFFELKTYLKLQKDYTRLEVTEKLSILLSTLIVVLLAVILGMMALFYISFMLVYLLAPVLGSLLAGFGLIAAFHVLLIFLLLAFRKQLIVNHMVRFIAGLFLTKPTTNDPPHEQPGQK